MKRIMRPKQVADYLAISMATLWRLTRSGEFVEKIQISQKAVGFYEEDVAEWLEKRKK